MAFFMALLTGLVVEKENRGGMPGSKQFFRFEARNIIYRKLFSAIWMTGNSW
jgi:hypothetical protein